MGNVKDALKLNEYMEWVERNFVVFNLKTEIIDNDIELSYCNLEGLHKTISVVYDGHSLSISSVVIYNEDELDIVQTFKKGLEIEEDAHNCGFFRFKVPLNFPDNAIPLKEFHKFIGFILK